MKTKKNLLVTAADKNYINQAKQLFSSAYWNGGWKGDYMLLSHNIPEKDLDWFRNKGILIYRCKPITRKGWKLWSNAAMDRFYLFTPEFKKWEHIIYLDGDIIIRGNLERLTNLNGFWAAKDGQETLNNGIRNIKKFLKGGYDLKGKYFNSGVFAFSTDIINNGEIFKNLNKLWKKYKKECKFPDQTILNLYFQNKWKELSPIYNFCPVNYYYNDIINDDLNAIIMHFRIPKKPWENKKSHFYPEWKKYLDKAEGIDLSIIQKGRKVKPLPIMYNKIFQSKKIVRNNSLGKIGLFIKRYNPKIYYYLGGKN
jgi:lipopolysaccharide biosynthesis glycosyltransferase